MRTLNAIHNGVGLHFLRTIGDIVRFKVISGNGQTVEQPAVEERAAEPVPVASDTPPTTKRRPRHPKQQTADVVKWMHNKSGATHL